MSVEDVIEDVIGGFGKYQTWILILLTLGRYPSEFQLSNVVFMLSNVNYECNDQGIVNKSNYCPCIDPVYDQSTIVSSVTTEWNLICDRRSLASLTQSMMQIGILIGSLLYGFISDRYGRKNASVLALFSTAGFVALSASLPKLWLFLVFRFLIGTGVEGTMLCCYILLIELTGKSFRPYLIGLHEISFISGYILIPVIASYVREWRYLQLVTSAPWLLVIVHYWLLPESPRWLITVGKKEEAIKLLSYIARKNGRPTNNIPNIVNNIEKESINETQYERGSYLDLFRTPKIRLYTIVVSFIWFCCAHTFFGVNQYIGNLAGNIYLNVMLSAVALIPGVILVVFATLHFRRKVSVVTSFLVASLSFLGIIFIPKELEYVILAFAIIGQIGAYTSFMQAYLFTSEVFPTVVRNSVMGFASMFARVGGFIAPFVVNIGIEWVSLIIFSCIASFGAFLCLVLPETRNIVLPNTIKQTER